MNAIVIESHDNDCINWLVSINGPNPEPWQFYKAAGSAAAFAYSARLNAAICPMCGSREILPPAMAKEMNMADSGIVTCDSCALIFNLPNYEPEVDA